MGSGRKIKFAVCELLQFAGFCIPLLIVMQRFAVIVAQAKNQSQASAGNATTAYWLIVASSVAYTTSVALLIWLPLKYMVFMKKKALVDQSKWRPVALAYVLLSTLPCFAFLIASSEVQIRNDLRLDTFAELPVSLILFSLICIDIVERIRLCRLTGQADELDRDPDIPSPEVTHIRVSSVVASATGPSPAPNTAADLAGQMPNGTMRGMHASATAAGLTGNGTAPVILLPNNGAISGLPPQGFHGNTTIPGLAGNFPHTLPYSGPLGFLLASDIRTEVFADSFLFWLDTVEMVRVAGHTPVYFSGWALPIYLFGFLSSVRLVLTPHSPVLSPLGVLLQDLPFLVLRTALISLFGVVTPLLYVMKNLLVCLAYIYFNFMTKLKMFNTERMF